MKLILYSCLIIPGLIWLVFLGFMYFFQDKFIYFPSREHIASPESVGLEYEEFFLETGDTLNLHAWYIPRTGARQTLLFLHGNAGNISHRLESIQLFHEIGLNVFIFDYRGYGKSEGKPDENGTYADAEAAWLYLRREKHLNASDIIVFGRSLGGGVASWLAAKYPPASLILESTFSSIDEIAAHYYPYFPVRWLSHIHYPTGERISEIHCPVLIVHSPEDEVVPFRFGQSIFRNANEPKTFLSILGDHNRGFLHSGSHYTDGLSAFIQSAASSPEKF